MGRVLVKAAFRSVIVCGEAGGFGLKRRELYDMAAEIVNERLQAWQNGQRPEPQQAIVAKSC
jgi:hypothetical protein